MSKLVNAFSDDALGTLDAVGIAEAIATGEISASEATEAAIQRAEKVNDALNAIVFKTYDMARENARAKHPGALSGVPAFIKDNEPVKGVPTQLGTLAFKAKPAKKNGRYVNQFLSTGLISLGKSTMPEFGFICSTENPKWGITRSPWDTDYTPGGSSSGSAAMVASGVVPIAVANDGAGSTRIPASCCALIGMKPSRGRLMNAEGTDRLPVNIVYEGVLTRTVRDTAAFYAAAEKYYRNPALPEMGHITHAGPKRLKIVFFDNIGEGKPGHQDGATYTTLLSTAKLLSSLGHEVEQLPFPPFDISELSTDFLNYYGMLAFALSSLGGLLLDSKPDRSQLEPFTTGLSDQFKRNILGIRRSIKRLQATALMMEGFFGKYDIIMTPVLAHSVPPIGHFSTALSYQEISLRAVSFAPFTGIQNISGSPAISVPSGISAEGLPIGMHFIAPFGQDKRLIELAYELEAARPWRFIYNSG
jgi:amidase